MPHAASHQPQHTLVLVVFCSTLQHKPDWSRRGIEVCLHLSATAELFFSFFTAGRREINPLCCVNEINAEPRNQSQLFNAPVIKVDRISTKASADLSGCFFFFFSSAPKWYVSDRCLSKKKHCRRGESHTSADGGSNSYCV